MGLDWRVDITGRVIPHLSGSPSIQIVIPFRDQRERTLACVAAVRRESYPALTITAVDNGSRDSTIRDALSAQGVDVFRLDQPFNFSRLIDCAAQRSSSDLIMTLKQRRSRAPRVHPGAGTMGYATSGGSGRLRALPSRWHTASWRYRTSAKRQPQKPAGEEIERGRHRSDLDHAARLRVVDAVSAGLRHMRRDVFAAVAGFDEINYPIAFSDTDLAQRVRQRGFACVDTVRRGRA